MRCSERWWDHTQFAMQPPVNAASGHQGNVAPSFASSSFRRGQSGILDEADESLLTIAAARGGAGPTSSSAWLEAASHGLLPPVQEGRPFVSFPLLPYYGILCGVVLEVPSTCTQLWPLLENWSRKGGGQSWRFGATWSERPTVAPVQLRLMRDAADFTSSTSRSVPAPTTVSGRSSGGSSASGGNRSWYGEYVEALSDGILQFFDCATAPPAMRSAARPSPPPTLYIEVRHHSRWRHLTMMMFVEDGVPNVFVASPHRPTQRYLTERAEEVDVALQWVNGASLVSTSSPTINVVDGGGAGTGGSTKRRRSAVVDPCRVIAEIVLNLDLLTMQEVFADPGSTATATASRVPAACDVSIAATFPFLHGSWQCHRFRPQGMLSTSSAAAGQRAHVANYYVSASCVDGTMELPPLTTTVAAVDGDNKGGGLRHVTSLRCVSCFVRGPPLMGTSLVSLVSLLVDHAKLDSFRLRFLPWPQLEAESTASGRPQRNHGAAAGHLATGVGLTAVGVHAGAAGGEGSSGRGVRTPLLMLSTASATMSNGLCYSRLSASSWLQPHERELVAEAAREDADNHDMEDDGDQDDVEAEFFPLSVEYQRSHLCNTHYQNGVGARNDTERWGASFRIENGITSMFGA